MKNILYYLSFIIIVSSCKKNGDIIPEKPENLLSEKQMADVLYDMALISAAKSTNRSILENSNVDPEEFIYKRHNIDSTQFAESNTYYSHDLNTYESIYQRVRNKLDKNKEHYQEVVNQERMRSDSLKDARKLLKDSLDVNGTRSAPLKNIDRSN